MTTADIRLANGPLNIMQRGPGSRLYVVTQFDQIVSGSGAQSLIDSSSSHTIITTGAASATLAAGFEGQEKFFFMQTDGGDFVLTVNNFVAGSTITFNDVGDSATLIYLRGLWIVKAANGVVIA